MLMIRIPTSKVFRALLALSDVRFTDFRVLMLSMERTILRFKALYRYDNSITDGFEQKVYC
jgi:hypothetical protein